MTHSAPDNRRFLSERIEVEYDTPPLLAKTPRCPDRFVWRGETFAVVALLEEWRDYGRRGRFARNMQPQHLRVAEQRGSWGVGRFFFKVRARATGAGGPRAERVFDIYYDRAPRSADERAGGWVVFSEWLEDDDHDA